MTDGTHDSEKLLPICIDLDGTLVRTDVLVESALALLKRNPLYLFVLPFWLLRGKAHLKQEIAQHVSFDPTVLPYDPRVVDIVRAETGCRSVVLCTAADRDLANKVAAYLGGFSDVMASDGLHNLSGRGKAEALVVRYGERGYDYAGNERKDLHVWRHARGAIVVNAAPGVAERVGKACEVLQVLPREPAGPWVWAKALRLHQWIKNLLVFVPLLAAHSVLDLHADGYAIAAFLIFGICASGVYVLNDLLDLPADRRHPRKCKRPFALGRLPLTTGLIAAPALTAIAFAAAALLSQRFALVLLGYFILTLVYSLWLKRVVMLDVVLLAALYTTRVVAGTIAINVELSFWLLAFSMFLFLSLAMVKRYAELHASQVNEIQEVHGRGYSINDLTLVQSLGGASGYVSVLVLALYVNSAASVVLYRRSEILWLLCPLLLYWVSRMWVIANRGAMQDDPVVFAMRDRVSLCILIMAGVITLLAI